MSPSTSVRDVVRISKAWTFDGLVLGNKEIAEQPGAADSYVFCWTSFDFEEKADDKEIGTNRYVWSSSFVWGRAARCRSSCQRERWGCPLRETGARGRAEAGDTLRQEICLRYYRGSDDIPSSTDVAVDGEGWNEVIRKIQLVIIFAFE